MYPVAETKSRYMFLCPDDYLWMMKEKVIVPPDHEEEGLYYHFYGHGGHAHSKDDEHELENLSIIPAGEHEIGEDEEEV